MWLRLLSFISLSILFACSNEVKSVEPGSKKKDTVTHTPDIDAEETRDSLLLDTINLNQTILNGLPMIVDTLTAIKAFGEPYNRNVFAMGSCYSFGDANLWFFDGCRYYVHKDSLYFHELYSDETKKQSFKMVLPRLTVTEKTKKEEFRSTYQSSFANSGKILSNTIIFRILGRRGLMGCQLLFEYKEENLWRIAVHYQL